ncbi:uncharacterized protein ISCGN_010251 [Ixodes scapularis]
MAAIKTTGGTWESRCLVSGVNTDPEPCGFTRHVWLCVAFLCPRKPAFGLLSPARVYCLTRGPPRGPLEPCTAHEIYRPGNQADLSPFTRRENCITGPTLPAHFTTPAAALPSEISDTLQKCPGTDLQKRQLEDVLRPFSPMFTKRPGKTDILLHRIETGNAPPWKCNPRSISLHKQELLDVALQEMLGTGAVRGTWESRCLVSGVNTDPEPCGFTRHVWLCVAFLCPRKPAFGLLSPARVYCLTRGPPRGPLVRQYTTSASASRRRESW